MEARVLAVLGFGRTHIQDRPSFGGWVSRGQECRRHTRKGKGRRDFSQRPLFMPATTYSPTHLARAVQSALRGLTSVFGMGTGGSPAVRSPTTRSRAARAKLLAISF